MYIWLSKDFKVCLYGYLSVSTYASVYSTSLHQRLQARRFQGLQGASICVSIYLREGLQGRECVAPRASADVASAA